MSKFILGAGMTGLSAGLSTGLPIFEAGRRPGGICSSYYMVSGQKKRLEKPYNRDKEYRFEIGGGHWIFGADQKITKFLTKYSKFKRYRRKSEVCLNKKKLFVPYPLQNHLYCFDKKTREKILKEISQIQKKENGTLEKWLLSNFGPTLCSIFFHPFHKLYTAGLYKKINPQDSYKTPFNLSEVIKGARQKTGNAGYNKEFIYPEDGLDSLTARMAKDCRIEYRKKVVRVNTAKKKIFFSDGESVFYKQIFSTLPLNKMINICKLNLNSFPDPYSSVLVLNLAGTKGRRCPDSHWVYFPESRSGFYRVGFYSNVDDSFLPEQKHKNDMVSMYIERAFPGGHKPKIEERQKYVYSVIKELQNMDFISSAKLVDTNWIDTAYTWSWPGSGWRREALVRLKEKGIYQAGRYGLWHFQGIADSISQGLDLKKIREK